MGQISLLTPCCSAKDSISSTDDQVIEATSPSMPTTPWQRSPDGMVVSSILNPLPNTSIAAMFSSLAQALTVQGVAWLHDRYSSMRLQNASQALSPSKCSSTASTTPRETLQLV